MKKSEIPTEIFQQMAAQAENKKAVITVTSK